MLHHIFNLIALLSHRNAQYLGKFVGYLLYLLNGRERRVAEININLCFSELAPDKKNKLIKQTLIENAKTLFEMPRIFKRGGQYALSLVREVKGVEHYHQAVKQGKGVIILAPHLGNWEVVIHHMNQFSSITAMFAPPKQAFLNDIMKAGRQSSGATLVPANTKGVRALFKHLKQGGVVGILPDQQPKSSNAGVFAPFMGHDAYTMLLVNSLAKRSEAVIVFAFAERLAIGKGYKLHVLPSPTGLDDADEKKAVAALNQGIEQCVRLAPAQYQWTYKRFNRQPDNKPSPYG